MNTPRASRFRDSRYPLALCAVGLVAYAVLNADLIAVVRIHVNDGSTSRWLLYSAWLACGFVTFFWLVIAAPGRVLWPILAAVFVSAATNYTYSAIVQASLTADVIEWLPYEIGQLGNAWGEYTRDIVFAIARTAILLGIFLVLRRLWRAHPGPASRVSAHRLAPYVATAAFLAFGVAAAVLRPPNSVVETSLYVFGLPGLLERTPEHAPLAVRPARAPAVDKIVLVVDESITREAYEKVVASRTRGLPVLDFGEAASIANCSAPSNALLRWGVERSRVRAPDYDPRTNPTIWAYARAAGFSTTLIDGQSKGQKQNYLSPGEIAMIGSFVPAAADDRQDTDVRIAQRLNELLRRPGRDFIIAVKNGAHFPYEMNYPRSELPVDAPRTAKYVAAVSHSTGAFFERLARDLPFDRVLLIYTSDHGQDLSKRAMHCNPQPAADEYSVPLLAITASKPIASTLNAARLYDRASHLNIFPTLLDAFGYDAAWTNETYGSGLSGAPATYLSFVNRGWQGKRGADRNRLQSGDFTETTHFPYRAAGERRRIQLEGYGASRQPGMQ